LGIICQKTLIINIQYKIKEIFKMGKFNLTEAAKDILSGNVAAKKGGQDKPQKLPTSVVTGQKDVGKVGDAPEQKDDANPDYTKGVPAATAPGATPPVGSQPAAKLSGDADQQSKGRSDLVATAQDPATDYGSIRDRIKAKLAKQTMPSNPGATFQSYAEEEVKDEEVVAEEKEEGHEDAAQDKAMIKAAMKKQKMKEDIEQDINALLSGENLSEEFVTKASTIFESAVIARTEAILEDIQEELFTQFEEAVEEVKEDLATKVDDYMNYMAEEWMKENALAIEKGLRAEIVEDFIKGLHDLFVEHYIDIPEEKVDVVEELTTRVEELESSLSEQINSAVQLKKELNEHKKIEAIHAVCEGLTQTQVEKMKSLAESIEFTTEEEFADKVVAIRESYFETAVKSADSSALNEEIVVEEEKKQSVSTDPAIAQYAQTISKTLVK
jgi:hypothetical protein